LLEAGHLPDMDEQGRLGLAQYNVPPISEASTDLCILVTEDGLKSPWRAIPLLRYAALKNIQRAKEALAWLNRWGRLMVRCV